MLRGRLDHKPIKIIFYYLIGLEDLLAEDNLRREGAGHATNRNAQQKTELSKQG